MYIYHTKYVNGLSVIGKASGPEGGKLLVRFGGSTSLKRTFDCARGQHT